METLDWSFATTKIVLSPAIVPIIFCIFNESMASQAALAQPVRVLRTIMLPDAVTVSMVSLNILMKRSVTGCSLFDPTEYLYLPLEERILTSCNSLMSREIVAWVTL